MTEDTIKASASEAALLRAGLLTELGIASEKIVDLTEFPKEQPKRAYARWRRIHEQACAVLDEIGWTSSPRRVAGVTIDVASHRVICRRALKGQLCSYTERMDEMEGDQRQHTIELTQDIHSLLHALQYS